jgi:hypothetical protein
MSSEGVWENLRILLANLLQSSKSTFSWENFLGFFAFPEGMLGTPISALEGWPTVSLRLMRHYGRALKSRSTPGKSFSDCRLIKHCLINSLGATVFESSLKASRRRCPQRGLTPKISPLLSENLIFNGVRSCYCRKALLGYHYPSACRRGRSQRGGEHEEEVGSSQRRGPERARCVHTARCEGVTRAQKAAGRP